MTYKVLVLCHANRFRSPLAEGCIKQAVERIKSISEYSMIDVQVSSAGFKAAGLPAGKPVRNAAAELGFSLEDHRSTKCTLGLVAQHDIVVVMDGGNMKRLMDMVVGQPECAGRSIFKLGEFCTPQRNRIEDLAFISPRTRPVDFDRVVRYILDACDSFTQQVIAPRALERQASGSEG